MDTHQKKNRLKGISVIIYMVQSVSGQNLNFRLQEAGLPELNDWATRAKTVIFYCPGITSCIIDGIQKNLVDTLDCRFNELQLTGPNFEIDTAREGRIAISDYHVLVDLLD